MDRADITVWIPLAAQNQRLRREMLCLWVCEEKSELGDELKLISLDPRSEDRVRISQMAEQRRDGSSSSADSDAMVLQHSISLEFRELFKLRIRQTPVSILSFHETDCFFLPDTLVYPAAAATCWFESTSSPHLLRWPLKKANKLFYICVISWHLEFLSIFWQIDIKWFSYSQLQVNKSLSTHPTCGQGCSVGDWRYASFILDPASASPATPLWVCLLHGGYFSAAEETVNQHQIITVSEMRI